MAYWTSTSFATVFRQAAALAKHVPRTTGAAALTGRRARLALKQLARETFPSLAQSPTGLVGKARSPLHAYAVEPVRIGGRHYRPMSSHARMYASASKARAAWTLPAGARGPRVTTNLGLGSARTFASGPTASSVPANVPAVLRAFAALLSDEDNDKSLPRASRFRPYNPRTNQQRRHRRAATRRLSTASCTSVDSRLSELAHYFPLRRRAAAAVALPCTAETLITPGTTTVLSLPLSPSLSALFAASDAPYAATEVGIAVFSSLTLGMLSLQEAFSVHYWHHIGPILARLDDLGFFGGALADGMRHELVLDPSFQPDSLRLTFTDRSTADVAALLRGYLVHDAGVQWWGLVQLGQEAEAMELSRNERKEMMEVWEAGDRQPNTAASPVAFEHAQILFEADDFGSNPPPDVTAQHNNLDLVYPILDMTASVGPTASFYSPSAADDAEAQVWDTSMSVGSNTPISDLDLDQDGLSAFSSSPGDYSVELSASSSSQLSLSVSLLSQLSALSPSQSNESERWAVQPSSSDSDVESAVMLDSGVWDDAEEVEQVDRETQYDEDYQWAGTGAGFGLAQSW